MSTVLGAASSMLIAHTALLIGCGSCQSCPGEQWLDYMKTLGTGALDIFVPVGKNKHMFKNIHAYIQTLY